MTFFPAVLCDAMGASGLCIFPPGPSGPSLIPRPCPACWSPDWGSPRALSRALRWLGWSWGPLLTHSLIPIDRNHLVMMPMVSHNCLKLHTIRRQIHYDRSHFLATRRYLPSTMAHTTRPLHMSCGIVVTSPALLTRHGIFIIVNCTEDSWVWPPGYRWIGTFFPSMLWISDTWFQNNLYTTMQTLL